MTNKPNLAIIAHFITSIPKHYEDEVNEVIEEIIFDNPSTPPPTDEDSDEWSEWFDREQIAGGVAFIARFWNREDDPNFLEAIRDLLLTPRNERGSI